MSESLIQYGPKGNREVTESILTHIFNTNNEISNPETAIPYLMHNL